jgi:hypothetical protein
VIVLRKGCTLEILGDDAVEGRAFTFQLVTPKRTLIMQADNEEDRQTWVNAINTMIKKFTIDL